MLPVSAAPPVAKPSDTGLVTTTKVCCAASVAAVLASASCALKVRVVVSPAAAAVGAPFNTRVSGSKVSPGMALATSGLSEYESASGAPLPPVAAGRV